jgi:hypothetical protein
MLAVCLAPAVAIHAGSASPPGARNARRGEGFEARRPWSRVIASSTTRDHDLNEATIPTGITFKWKFGERRPRFPQASQTKRGSRSDA